ASVLVTGESGTGKELIAEAIHANSGRAGRPFVKVNLGGVSSQLFDSEMFGHVKGAFTDAGADRLRPFETANRGTIFLAQTRPLRPVRNLERRDYLPRRDRRARCVIAGEDAASSSGPDLPAARIERSADGRRSSDLRDQPGPRAGGRARRVSRGPPVPDQPDR